MAWFRNKDSKDNDDAVLAGAPMAAIPDGGMDNGEDNGENNTAPTAPNGDENLVPVVPVAPAVTPPIAPRPINPSSLPLIGEDEPALGEIIGAPPLGSLGAIHLNPTGSKVVLPPESGPDQVCPTCQEAAPFDARFCEACGSDLDPTATAAAAAESEPLVTTPLPADPVEAAPVATEPCVSCAADPSEIDSGYCGVCGTKQPAARDHIEVDHGWFAAVTDRGISHHQNEDAMSIGSADDAVILVVCDGVSSTDRPDEASQSAADLVREHLTHAIESGADMGGALLHALDVANEKVSKLEHAKGTEPPSCTVVAAASTVLDGTVETIIGWVGDSRAYWIDGDTVTQLTTDHSWAAEQEALGQLDADAIASDPRAHSITRWLGADDTVLDPDLMYHTAAAATGRLLLCSDGLWNYAETEAAMARHVAEHPGNPLHTARELTSFAVASGGRDNITVAIADFSMDHSAGSDPTLPGTDESGAAATSSLINQDSPATSGDEQGGTRD